MAEPTSLRAPPGPVEPLRHVLLATDLSPASAPATEEAIAIARRSGARLTVLSVVDPRILRLPGGRFLRRVDQEQARVEAEVQVVVARARRVGIASTFLVWHGDPSDVILDAAEAEDADLVVMGSHGRGRLGRLVLGSTSDARLGGVPTTGPRRPVKRRRLVDRSRGLPRPPARPDLHPMARDRWPPTAGPVARSSGGSARCHPGPGHGHSDISQYDKVREL